MKKALKFGIDIDGTVTCPKTFVPYLNKSFNLNLTFEDIKDYNLAKAVNITDEEMSKWFLANEAGIYEASPIAEDAKETLTEWSNEFELIYISARDKRYEQITNNWFIKNSIPYDLIHCTGQHNKILPVQVNGIDLFFEDNYKNACQINESCGIPVVLFDTPYNQGNLPKEVKRVSNWQEANIWVRNWVMQTI